MSDPSITEKTVRGAGWAISWRLLTRLIGLASTLVLVRLLGPSDIGLVALALAFATAIDTASSMGTDYALIRERAIDRALYDTGFTLNLLRGLLTFAVLLLAAAPVADFMREPRLAAVLMVLAAGALLPAMENIGIVDFRRDFAFAKEFRLFLIPRLIGAAANIAAAFLLRSHWALIIGLLLARASRTVASYAMHPYRPRLSLAAWRSLAGFSVWLWATGMVMLLRARADSLVLGRMLDPAKVGIFSVGSEIALLPSTEIMEPVSRALYPGFAAAQHGGANLGAAYLRALGAIFLIVLPAAIGLSLVADPLVPLALGPAWLDAIPLVQILAFAGPCHVIIQTGGNIMGVRGETRLMFRLCLFGAALRMPLLIVLVLEHALVGAAVAITVVVAMEAMLYAWVGARRMQLGIRDHIRPLWRPLLASVAMAAALLASGLGWTATPAATDPDTLTLVTHLLTAGALGAAVYAGSIAVLWLLVGRPAGVETTALGLLRIRR